LNPVCGYGTCYIWAEFGCAVNGLMNSSNIAVV